MGDEAQPATRVLDMPHRQRAWNPLDAPLGEEPGASGADAFDEVAVRLAPHLRETVPALVRGPTPLPLQRGVRVVARQPLPPRPTNLAQPLLDGLVASEPFEQ